MFVGELRDDRAAPCPANQQTLGHQFFDRAADRADTDAEFLGQLRLRRDLVAGRPLAGTKALENTGADDFIERLFSRVRSPGIQVSVRVKKKESEKSRSIRDEMAARRTRFMRRSGPIRSLHANSGRIQDRHPHA